MKTNLPPNKSSSNPDYDFGEKKLSQDQLKLSILKKTREAKGLTLENVHEATKVPMDVLRAIEEGYSVRSVSPFYYKGFIKIYATFLEINSSEVLEALPKQQNNIRRVSEIEKDSFDFTKWIDTVLTRQRKQQITIAIISMIALFVAFKIIRFVGSHLPHRKTENSEQARSKKIQAALLEKEKKVEKAKKKEPVKITKEEAKEIKEEKQTQLAKEKEDVQDQKVAETKAVETAVEPKVSAVTESGKAAIKNVTLTARAKKNIWLLVKADEQVVFQSTLSTGSVETWLANNKIEISGRNLNQLEFELNGKMIGALGREDRQAKRIVFTKEGLSVTK